jgi:hypothetical protein
MLLPVVAVILESEVGMKEELENGRACHSIVRVNTG